MFRSSPNRTWRATSRFFRSGSGRFRPKRRTFALRLAVFELDKLIQEGLSRRRSSGPAHSCQERESAPQDQAGRARIRDRQPVLRHSDYTGYVRNGLAKLTVKDVNDAIRRHLRTTDLRIVAVARDTDLLKKKLSGNSISEMSYNSPKPQDVLDEDKVVERFRSISSPSRSGSSRGHYFRVATTARQSLSPERDRCARRRAPAPLRPPPTPRAQSR